MMSQHLTDDEKAKIIEQIGRYYMSPIADGMRDSTSKEPRLDVTFITPYAVLSRQRILENSRLLAEFLSQQTNESFLFLLEENEKPRFHAISRIFEGRWVVSDFTHSILPDRLSAWIKDWPEVECGVIHIPEIFFQAVVWLEESEVRAQLLLQPLPERFPTDRSLSIDEFSKLVSSAVELGSVMSANS